MKVLIVGAGASGMMAAIAAKRQGNDVVLIEQLKEPGKKIMATGNGKCNFTNRLLSREHYCSIDPNFVDHVFKQFSNPVFTVASKLVVYPSFTLVHPYGSQTRGTRWFHVFELIVTDT